MSPMCTRTFKHTKGSSYRIYADKTIKTALKKPTKLGENNLYTSSQLRN